MIRTVMLDSAGRASTGGAEQIAQWQAQPKARIWIDLQGEDAPAEKQLLGQLGCHPLAVKDALRKRHPPKIETFENYCFILYRGIQDISGDLGITPQQISFFVGDRCLITRHPSVAMSIDRWMDQDSAALLFESPGRLALAIIHSSLGLYLEHLLAFEGRLSDIEDSLLKGGSDALMRELIRYKSRLVKLKRTFSYHEGITRELSARPHAFVDVSDAKLEHYITDLHERCERTHSLAQMYYDICTDLIEGYISIASHQLNLTMRVLTVITAIFVPLSFMAGLYGMNFEVMPELKHPYGYFFLLGSMGLVALGLLATFRWKKWI